MSNFTTALDALSLLILCGITIAAAATVACWATVRHERRKANRAPVQLDVTRYVAIKASQQKWRQDDWDRHVNEAFAQAMHNARDAERVAAFIRTQSEIRNLPEVSA